jgi:tetraacyldisaccharide 4'-kinase
MQQMPLKKLFHKQLPVVWLSRGWMAWALWPVSLVYGFLVRLRQGLFISGVFSSKQLPVPVLVVGNVVAGGAGKTPLVMAMVRHFKQQGLAVGVIARNVGATAQHARDPLHTAEVHHNSLPEDVGDEPLMVKRNTDVAVWTGSSRYSAGLALLSHYPETQIIICDDGLQHLALKRTLEVVVFDDRGTSNGWLLPAGPLREPWPRPCDLVVHTGRHPRVTSIPGFVSKRTFEPLLVNGKNHQMAWSVLKDSRKPIWAVAGIAHPEVFFDMLEEHGLGLQQALALPDHFQYRSSWLQDVLLSAANEGEVPWLLCTEKDAVKLWQIFPQAWAVPLDFQPEPAFWQALDRLMARN